MKSISSWHVGVAAEAYAAAIFARYGYDVSVQYGANQPEYDLIAVSGDQMLKISVKGSQDGSWGLTQGFKKNCDYHEAIARWLSAHHRKNIFDLQEIFCGYIFIIWEDKNEKFRYLEIRRDYWNSDWYCSNWVWNLQKELRPNVYQSIKLRRSVIPNMV